MRILRYYPRAVVGDGGITRSVWHHAREGARAGAEVVIAYDEGTEPPSPEGVELVQLPHRGWPWKVPRGLAHVLDEVDVTVLHSAWTYYNVRAGAACRRRGVPYVLEPRGAYDPRILARKRLLKRAWWWLWERRLVAGARAIHAFFESQIDDLREIGWDGPVVVVPNGVEVPPYARDWDGGSGGYLLWYGRFDPEHKGIDLLVRAVERLPEAERPEVRLHGPDSRLGGKSDIRRMVAELGLERWITIGEAVYEEEKYELLAHAVGFVYPSRWEAFGNAPAEACSVGLPTVVTPYPLGRHLASRDGAILVEPTPGGLAEGIRALRASDATSIGRRGREVVRGELAWASVVESWLEQVEALI